MDLDPGDLVKQLLGRANRVNQRVYYPARRAGEITVINYLSTIIFFALMGIGYLLLGRDVSFTSITPTDIAAAVGWTFLSWYLAAAVKIAAQWEKALVFRLGRFKHLRGPGVYTLLPLIDQAQTVDTRVITLDIPRQEAITKDNVPVSIDGVIFMQVVRPDQAIINVQDYAFAITQYAQTALRDVIGGRTLDEVLTERESIGHHIEQLVEQETEHWGLEVAGIRIQDILLPEDLKKVMSRQAAAEREKRANITKSEGDRMAAENLAAAAATMAKSPGAMQLRSLQTIDGLGPTASNTVVLAIPIEVMEAVDAFAAMRRRDREPST